MRIDFKGGRDTSLRSVANTKLQACVVSPMHILNSLLGDKIAGGVACGIGEKRIGGLGGGESPSLHKQHRIRQPPYLGEIVRHPHYR